MTSAFRPYTASPTPDGTVELVRQTLCDLLELITAGEPFSARITFRGVRVRLDAVPAEQPAPVDEPAAEPTVNEQMADFHGPPAPPVHPHRGPLYSSRCAASIVRLLTETGRRMTLQQMANVFEERRGEWSYSAISHTAPIMKAEGVLDHQRDGRGRGYGLCSWSEPAPEDGA